MNPASRTNEGNQGQLLLRQAQVLSQEVVYDADIKSTDSRIEEAVRANFDNMVNELTVVIQQQVDEAIKHVVEDQLGGLRESVIKTLEAECTIVKK